MQKNYVSENDTLFLVFSPEESASSGEMANGIIADFAADGSIVSIRINNFARRKDHLELKLRLQRLDQIKPLVAESRVSYSAGKIAPKPPRIIMICGPNGAGKSTAAPDILQGGLKVDEFVNADVIALGLSAFRPEKAAVKAGRVMLSRLSELAVQRSSFACETTLAARSFSPNLIASGEGSLRETVLMTEIWNPLKEKYS